MTSSNADIRPISSRSVVAQVTEELRRVILAGVLAPGQEFSLREIATMLDQPVGTIKGRMRLGLTKMRMALGDPAEVVQ